MKAKIKHVGKGALEHWLSKLEAVNRVASMETSRFGFPQGMPGTTPLPITEKDVDDFIRERTRIWRQSWIHPDLMHVINEIRDALGRESAEPLPRQAAPKPPAEGDAPACVACGKLLQTVGKLIPTERGLACVDCLISAFETFRPLESSEGDSVAWMRDSSNCAVYYLQDSQGGESDAEATRSAHLFSFAAKFYDALRRIRGHAEDELNDLAADVQEGGRPPRLSSSPWNSVVCALAAFDGNQAARVMIGDRDLEEGETCPDCLRPFNSADVSDTWDEFDNYGDFCPTCGMIYFPTSGDRLTPAPDPNKAVELSSWDRDALKLIFDNPGRLTPEAWGGIAHLKDDLTSRDLIVFDVAEQPFLTPKGINSLREADPLKDSNPPLEVGLGGVTGTFIVVRLVSPPVQIQRFRPLEPLIRAILTVLNEAPGVHTSEGNLRFGLERRGVDFDNRELIEALRVLEADGKIERKEWDDGGLGFRPVLRSSRAGGVYTRYIVGHPDNPNSHHADCPFRTGGGCLCNPLDTNDALE